MKKNEKILGIVVLTVVSILCFSVGNIYGMSHIDYDNPDWECKKWVGIVELAKQDYPNFIEETLEIAEKKCGFDVNEITS